MQTYGLQASYKLYPLPNEMIRMQYVFVGSMGSHFTFTRILTNDLGARLSCSWGCLLVVVMFKVLSGAKSLD